MSLDDADALAGFDDDLLLRLLVVMVNGSEDDTGIDLVLTVGGREISGTLVPAAVWARRVADAARDAAERAGASSRTSALLTVLEGHQDRVEHDRPSFAEVLSEDRLRATQFIHLLDASVAIGEHVASLAPWRGRLSAVDGWALGTLG